MVYNLSMAAIGHTNPEFELRGLNHIALVCRDMAETVAWYEDVLGMKLVKTLEYPSGGQHFFLDMGNGRDGIAFFWYPDGKEGVPGESISAVYDDDMQYSGSGGGTAIGTMNHLAFDVAPEVIDDYLVKLRAKGVAVTEITNHANSLSGGHKADYQPGSDDDGDVFIRSLYFKDPNGTLLEFACWTTTFDESDVQHQPASARRTEVGATT